jgi:hypothetical protein
VPFVSNPAAVAAIITDAAAATAQLAAAVQA